MKKILLIIIPVIAILLFAGCGRVANPIIEKKILQTVRNRIMAENWDCKLIGDPNLKNMILPDITVTGTNILYKKAKIEKLTLHLENTEINIHTKSIKSCEKATANIKIKDSEVTDLLKEYITNVKNPEIISENDKIILKCQTEILNHDVSLETKGNLRIENGINVILEPETFKVMKFGITIPNIAKKLIWEKINPVYRIEENPYGIHIENFHYRDGYFFLKATFDPVKILSLVSE